MKLSLEQLKSALIRLKTKQPLTHEEIMAVCLDKRMKSVLEQIRQEQQTK